MKPFPPVFFRAGFTTLELIITVGVIATLLALAFSGFSIAISKKDDLTCLNNLRAHYIAARHFASDNQGKFPSNNMRTELHKLMGIAVLSERKATPMTCPALQRIAPTDHYMHANYGINQFLTSAYDHEIKSWQKIRYFQAVEQPSRRFFFMDGAHGGLSNQKYYYNAMLRPEKGTFVFPHKNGQHVLFVDGHSEHLSREEFLKPENTDLTTYAQDNPWSAR